MNNNQYCKHGINIGAGLTCYNCKINLNKPIVLEQFNNYSIDDKLEKIFAKLLEIEKILRN